MAMLDFVTADSPRALCDKVNRSIRSYETGHVHVQVVTTVVPDNRTQSGTRVIYEAFVTFPGRN